MRSREKKSGRKSFRELLSFKDSPFIGMMIGLLTWLIASVSLNVELLFNGNLSEKIVSAIAAESVYLLIALISSGVFLRISCPQRSCSNSSILLMSVISLLTVFSAKGILHLTAGSSLISGSTAGFLLPFALAPMLTAILLGGREAMVTGLWTAFVISIMANQGLELLLAGIIGTSIASKTAASIRTRARIFKAGTITGLSETLAVLSLTIMNWTETDTMTVLHQSAACVASGFASAIMTMLLIPLLEHIFGITTDVTLLELSDMGHPLLQRLAMEAPGTYHHSLVVANLAQAAASQVGANPLLARVSAYFHDIGKLTKPDFFAENINLGNNPHDDLPPSMSTLIIVSHVKEGVSLALLHKLPEIIIKVIREHHGTSLISYFHHKAKTQMEFELSNSEVGGESPATINDGDFRYPGPRPSSTESVIVGLADAVEAASRTMQKVSPSSIKDLVNDIVTSRFEDSQLDDADLSLSALTQIKKSFVFSLTNMLHGRIPYPKDEDRDKQPAKASENQQA